MADKWAIESNVEELQRKILRWSRVAPGELRKALENSAVLIQREAQEKHFRLPKMDRGIGHPTMAWLGTSAAYAKKGKAGKNTKGRHQWWRLRNSITRKVIAEPGRFYAIVGTNIWYGRKHEFGIGVPYRPFLRPSLEAKRPQAFDMLEKALMKSYGK